MALTKPNGLALDHVRVTITAKLVPQPKPRKPQAVTKALQTSANYAAILAFIEKHGHITSAQAASIGGWKQPGHHLRKMQERGLIQRTEYGKWRWKCQACGKVPVYTNDCECLL